jgi:dCMP deaminase
MTDQNKWDERYMWLAFHVAGWSKDPTTQVGAVIVGLNPRQISLGYNGFPPGVMDDPGRYADRKLKNILSQHAERNAMDNATFELHGATLITTAFPCVECAKSIASKGIIRVVTPPPPDPLPGEPGWRDLLQYSQDIFDECCIEVKWIHFSPLVSC